MMKKINISQKLSQFKDHWNPRIIGETEPTTYKTSKVKRGIYLAQTRW